MKKGTNEIDDQSAKLQYEMRSLNSKSIKKTVTHDVGRCSSRTFETRSCHFWFPWYLRHIRQSSSWVDPTTIDKALEWTSCTVNAADFYQPMNTHHTYAIRISWTNQVDCDRLWSVLFAGGVRNKLSGTSRNLLIKFHRLTSTSTLFVFLPLQAEREIVCFVSFLIYILTRVSDNFVANDYL